MHIPPFYWQKAAPNIQPMVCGIARILAFGEMNKA
jgi:hypothetical protein